MEHNVDPFPVSESLLCYFVASLGQQRLAPSTIKTYLAGIRHAQIVRGYPAPRESSSLPQLGLLQAGVKRVHAEQGSTTTRRRLLITQHHLHQIRESLESQSIRHGHHDALGGSYELFFFSFFSTQERLRFHQQRHSTQQFTWHGVMWQWTVDRILQSSAFT